MLISSNWDKILRLFKFSGKVITFLPCFVFVFFSIENCLCKIFLDITVLYLSTDFQFFCCTFYDKLMLSLIVALSGEYFQSS